jgi:hypothetical protein
MRSKIEMRQESVADGIYGIVITYLINELTVHYSDGYLSNIEYLR